MSNASVSQKEKYATFCEKIGAPIYTRPFWLDAALGPSNWDLVTVNQGPDVLAAWPFSVKRRLFIKKLSSGVGVPRLGPMFDISSQKTETRLSRTKELLEALESSLPRAHLVTLKCEPANDYLLPLHWRGYRLQAAYTYRAGLTDGHDTVWRSLSESSRREIRKARRQLEVVSASNGVDLEAMVVATYARQGINAKPAARIFRRLAEMAIQKRLGAVLVARDLNEVCHAAIFVAWDDMTAYYLAGGADPQLRSSGAHSLLMWEGLCLASEHSQIFDFEGSMIPHVERFFRGFGAVPTVYVTAKKTNFHIF